jgi:hypothetical protein
LNSATRLRIAALIEEGHALFDQFDRSVRDKAFHPFVPADHDIVLETLMTLRESPGRRHRSGPPSFIELGSGHGVITIMADLIGFDAVGIELDGKLVDTARELAARHDSRARFVAGSFLPTGYKWKAKSGDNRMGTIGSGPSGYLELGRPLDEFDIIYVYPWVGEAPIVRDLVRRYADPSARLILMDAVDGVDVTTVGEMARVEHQPVRPASIERESLSAPHDSV